MFMALTTKELLLVKDNVKMTQNGVSFLRAAAEIATEPQIKTLCNQMATEHQSDIQMLVKHVSSTSVQ
jgi:hypothetical protein